MKWFHENGRHYPWRSESNPFKILISEIMLQRSRADQVLPIYTRFISKWNDAELSSAHIDEISTIFAGLRLLWRSKLVLEMAKTIQEKHKGRVPSQRSELLDVSGVGDYIADAMLVFAFKKKRTIVDSNVVCLVTRFFEIEIKGETRRNKDFIKFCNALTERLPLSQERESDIKTEIAEEHN